MQYICRTRAQTTDFSHNAGQKDESGCNSFKYDFRIPETSRGHGDTNNSRHHHKCVTVSPHSGLRPGPLSQTVLCLLISPVPVLWNTGTGSLKSCGLWISNVRAPSLTSHSDQPRQTQPLPFPLPLSTVTPRLSYSHKHQPGLPSHTRPGHRAPRILRKNANKLADLHPVSLHELSHQHSRVMCGFAIGHAIVSNPRQLCWITTFYQLMFMTLEDAWIETFLMGMSSNDHRFFQTHTRVHFLAKKIIVDPVNIPTSSSCILPFYKAVITRSAKSFANI